MQTPAAIVPEWYLLPFYAILRSIPNKLLGVIAMFSAILILLLLPITDVSRSRGMQFRPLSKAAFFVFVANFLILMQLGAKHVESPFIEFGQISTVLYFLYFTVVMYGVTIVENTFIELRKKKAVNWKVTATPLMSSVITDRAIHCIGKFLMWFVLFILYTYFFADTIHTSSPDVKSVVYNSNTNIEDLTNLLKQAMESVLDRRGAIGARGSVVTFGDIGLHWGANSPHSPNIGFENFPGLSSLVEDNPSLFKTKGDTRVTRVLAAISSGVYI